MREGRAGLVRRWREFVEQVERGYRLGLEDYRNELDIRGILELAGAVNEEVRALDERLRSPAPAGPAACVGERARRSLLGFRLSAQCGRGVGRGSAGGGALP